MAELADALDSGSSEGFLHAGSSPVSRTKQKSSERISDRKRVRMVFLCAKRPQRFEFLASLHVRDFPLG